MSKNIKLLKNMKGGLDLMVDKDAGNPVFITTGKASRSLEFWKEMRTICIKAVDQITSEIKPS